MNLYSFIKKTTEGGTKVLPVLYKGKAPTIKDWTNNSSSDKKQIDRWFNEKQTNAGIPTGKINNLWVFDVDKKNNGFESLGELEENVGPIVSESNYVVDTGGGGLHIYFQLRDNETIPNLNSFVKGIDVRSDGGQIVSPFSTHENGNIYLPRIDHEDKTLYVDQLNYAPIGLVQYILNSKNKSMSPMSAGNRVADSSKFYSGERNTGLFKRLCQLRNAPYSWEGFLAMAQAENLKYCEPALEIKEVEQIATSVFSRYANKNAVEPFFDDKLYYGILGKLVNLVRTETEASPEAIYNQSLIMLGNLANRKFYLPINGTRLYTNEFNLIIGKTSKARKGTSFKVCSFIFKKVWGEEFNNRLIRGISTGEGIVWALRDPVIVEKINKKGEVKQEVIDIGRKDKNAILVEEEFSKPLKNSKRETNNLSEVIRIAYDSDDLQSLSKAQPAKVTNPNISIIGHTTKEEFIKTLNSVEKDNGMLNRFLFTYSYRKNIISRPKSLDNVKGINEIIRELSLVRDFIHKTDICQFDFTDEGLIWWDRFYQKYAVESDTTNENIKGRTEVHILKLAMILAISDRESKLDVNHLESAKAIVDYSNQTIDYTFSNSIQNQSNDRLIKFISRMGNVCKRSDISHKFYNRKKKAFEIDLIRDQLINENKIIIEYENNSEFWKLATYRHGDIGDIAFVDS